jgi:aryl-alcohol dehydrogenase-like predicted oxidoreductase
VAREHGVPPSQIALAWLLRNPVISSPIIGATKPQHLEDAVGSLSVKLSDEEVVRLEELYQPHPATEAFS